VLFSKKRLLPQQKRAQLLLVLGRYLESGVNLSNAITNAYKDERDPRTKIALEQTMSYINAGEEIPMALQKAGIVDEREYVVLKYAKSKILIAMKEVIELSKRSDTFVSTLRGTLLAPIIAIPISLMSFYFIEKYVLQKIKSTYVQVAMLTKKELSIPLDIIYDNAFILLVLGILIYIVFFTIIILYKSFYEARTDIVYNYFKLRYYLDAPYILSLMLALNKATGFNLTHVAQELKRYIKPSGLSVLFEKIERSQSHNGIQSNTSSLGLRTVLQQFHFNPAVIRNITLAQNRGINEFWKGIETALVFAEDQKDEEIRKWRLAGKYLLYISLFCIIISILSMSGYIYMYSWEIKNAIQR